MKNQKEKGFSSLAHLIIIIVIVLGLGGGYIALRFQESKPGELTTEGPVDCGSDFDCFITASESCTPSSTTRTITVNLFGVPANIKEDYTLEGFVDGRCSLLLTSETLEVGTKATQKCLFDSTKNLAASLRSWKRGDTPPDSWDADCEIIDEQVGPTPSGVSSIVGSLPIEDNLPNGWLVKSKSNRVNRKIFTVWGGIEILEQPGFLMTRTMYVKSSYDDSVGINIFEFDSEANSKEFFDTITKLRTDSEVLNILESTCKSKSFFDKGYSVECYKDRYYFWLIVGDKKSPSFEESKAEGLKLIEAIGKAMD